MIGPLLKYSTHPCLAFTYKMVYASEKKNEEKEEIREVAHK